MINSVYGKTMENLRKGIKVKLVHNTKGYIFKKNNKQTKFCFTKSF